VATPTESQQNALHTLTQLRNEGTLTSVYNRPFTVTRGHQYNTLITATVTGNIALPNIVFELI